MSRKSLIVGGESAGIRTQDPRLKRASRLAAITNYEVRLIAGKALLAADFQTLEWDGFVLRHIGNRDQNRDRTVTKTGTKSSLSEMCDTSRLET
ncbi:MAG: hypothetical protein K0S45_2834 [Nitrospira sp.]|nr:hypothetical protein [Nitrospira sp.]